MGYWIEIHCDIKSFGPPGELHLNGWCSNESTSYPMGMAKSTRASYFKALKYLTEQAKGWGWKKTREGWICPNCQKYREDVPSETN